MRVLHVIGTVNPRTGGPIEWVTQLSLALQRNNHGSDIVCLDDPESIWLKNSLAGVTALGNNFHYMYSRRLAPWLKENAKRYDCVVVHGIWRYVSLGTWRALRRSNVPYLVYTHGMLGPWFKHTYPVKHFLKSLYWTLIEHRVLRDACAVLYTCEEEMNLAQQSFRLYMTRREAVTMLGVSPPALDPLSLRETFFEKFPQTRNKRLLLFLGRIHIVKGCDMLIDAFARIVPADERLCLVMAGPDQHGLARELQSRAARLGVSERIVWTGMLSGNEKWGAYSAAEVFVLPSHHENFGVTAIEAMACGTPVLISNKVNIWREISTDGVGFVNNDDTDGIVDMLENWIRLAEPAKQEMRLNAKAAYAKRFEINVAANHFLQTLRDLGISG